MITWTELANKLKMGEIEYLEIFDDVVYFMNNQQPEYRNLVGAIEYAGDGWIVRWGIHYVTRLPIPQNPITDTYQLIAYIYFMTRGNMENVVILPLSQRREWTIWVL